MSKPQSRPARGCRSSWSAMSCRIAFLALIVQATYVCASAMLTEAILSFLGAGTPPEIPSWGNMMAEGRAFFPIAPRIILFPGVALALMILAVNVLGDGLRDRLDPKLARRV